MILYKCLKTFFCAQLKRYIAKDALVYRYENTTKINISGSPFTDPTTLVTSDTWEFEDEKEVTWFYELEPSPGGTSTAGFFEFVAHLIGEDAAGGGLGAGAANRRKIIQTGHGFVIGDVVRIDDVTEIYELAQADTAIRSEVVGIISQIIDADTFVITTDGAIDFDGSSAPYLPLDPGLVYFLSLTVAGSLQPTTPTAVGDINKPVLIAETADVGYIQNFRGVEVTPPPTSDKVISGFLSIDDTESGTVDQVDITEFRTAKWLVSVADGTNGTFLSEEIFAQHDGTSASHTEFSIQGSASVTFDITVSAGFMSLNATATDDDQVINSERIAVLI